MCRKQLILLRYGKKTFYSCTKRQFMSRFKRLDKITIGALGSIIYLSEAVVKLEPDLAGDIPKMLLETVGKNEPAFFIHLSKKGDLFTDDGKVICNLRDTDICIIIER